MGYCVLLLDRLIGVVVGASLSAACAEPSLSKPGSEIDSSAHRPTTGAGGGADSGGGGDAGMAAGAAGGAGGSMGSAGMSGGIVTSCPSGLPGSPMVLVASPEGVKYCVDAHEVRQGEYADFLVTKGYTIGGYPQQKGDVSGQPEKCALNKTFYPSVGAPSWGSCPDQVFDPEAHPDGAMGCIDPCDAIAYCRWAGKRLCGRIGGGALTEAEATDATKDMWFNACSQGGKTKFSYGNEYNPSTCADGNPPDEPSVLNMVGDPDCHGATAPFDAIFDMSGNAHEWQDLFIEGNFGAYARGGALNTSGDETACAEHAPLSTSTPNPAVGFRCCFDGT